MTAPTAHQILQDPAFLRLVRRKNTVTVVLTLVELVLYFGFISLVAYNKPYLARKLGDSAITIGIPIAVGVIVLSWILTGIYIYWANSRYDMAVRDIKAKVGR